MNMHPSASQPRQRRRMTWRIFFLFLPEFEMPEVKIGNKIKRGQVYAKAKVSTLKHLPISLKRVKRSSKRERQLLDSKK
jgi:hypothetical protein